MYTKYMILYSYYPYVLNELQEQAERHEKDIYHELREAYGKDRTRITDNNTTWKAELKDMLNLNNSSINTTINNQLFLDITSDIEQAVSESFYYHPEWYIEFIMDDGIKKLMNQIKNGQFEGSPKKLTDDQLRGLRRELLVSLKRFNWAKNLSPDAVTINTYKFEGGAYSEGRLDIAVQLNTRDTKQRQIRSEVKNYTEIFKIGSLDFASISTIIKTAWFTVDRATNELKLHLSSDVIEDVCNEFLRHKYTRASDGRVENLFPIIEDGGEIILFSEFIENLSREEPSKALQLRTYSNLGIYNNVSLTNPAGMTDWYAEIRNKEKEIRKQLLSAKKDYTLWYGNKDKSRFN